MFSEPNTPFDCQAVFLEAALGLLWQGHLDQACLQSGNQIDLPEVLFILQVKRRLKFLSGDGFAAHCQQALDFRGHFRGQLGDCDIAGCRTEGDDHRTSDFFERGFRVSSPDA